jgi:hypothetical protein
MFGVDRVSVSAPLPAKAGVAAVIAMAGTAHAVVARIARRLGPVGAVGVSIEESFESRAGRE